MFLNEIIQNTVLEYYRILDHFMLPSVKVDIFEQLGKAKRILIVTPSNAEDFSVAQKYISTLTQMFQNASISVIISEEHETFDSFSTDYHLLKITKNNITALGFPNKKFLVNLQNTGYDIIIDLTPEYDFFSTSLCRASGSALKICLSSPKRDPFYNFLIRTDSDLSLSERYEILLHYLRACVVTEPSSVAS